MTAFVTTAARWALIIVPGFALIAEAAAQSASVEEIVVTARKRSESLLEIPVAVSAFTSRQIESTGA
ncbi:MAG: hypothetical protein SFV21_13675, partial [Rhodospirillaceae bacterium]|nr:hypothetical protein [Rhodospirillaceae bacterium]